MFVDLLLLHLHTELEGGAEVFTRRVAAYLTSTLIYDQLADYQAHTDALNVLLSRSSQLAE